MATGRNIPELGGYDYEFTSKVAEDWECPVCRITLKDPVQIVGCGHRLCKICMESLLRSSSPRCPVDRQPLSREKIFPDVACHRTILNLAVKCPHSGCSWIGELRAVKEHQSECKVVKCSNSGCTKMLSKRDMKTHETLECSWRKVDCEYCQQSVIMNQKQEHFKTCRTFPVLCTNKCGRRDIPREKLEAHILDECPATKVQCEYKNLGCEEVFPRSAAKSHSQTQIQRHLSLTLRGLEATQYQVYELVAVVKEQSQQLERKSQQIELQSQRIELQLQQIKELISKDKEQSLQIERQSQQIKELISKDKEQSQQIERQSQQSEQIKELISKVKKQSEKMERPIFTAQDQPLQGERRGSMNQIFSTPFQWRIRIPWADSKDLLSEPFYLFKGGYKYIIKISSPVPFWKHVLIKVVCGEFDGSLSWPCKEKVCLTVIDPQQALVNLNNISVVFDFEKGKEPCSRPVHDDHHEYRFILGLDKRDLIDYSQSDTILLYVSRE